MNTTCETATMNNNPDYCNNTCDGLVIDHLGLVKSIASRMRGSLPSFIDLDDLVQAGTLGLLDAARKFTPDKQVSFPLYAKHRIRGAILDSLRSCDNASRETRQWQKRIAATINDLTAKLERTPDESEIAEALEIDVKRLRSILVHVRSLEPVSASTRKNEELSDPEFPAPPSTYPDTICAQNELNGVLNEAVKTLSPRDRDIVRLYYVGGMTMRDIAKQLGVNESRVSQVHSRAIGRLGTWMRSNNINSSMAA